MATDLQKRYNAQRARIKRLVTYYKNRGYNVDIDNILPPIPKRITEGSVRRLESITSERIKNKATISHALAEKKEEPKLSPKKTAKEKAEQIREDFYDSTPYEAGAEDLPYEAPEVILNTIESFEGSERFEAEDWEDLFDYNVEPKAKPMPDKMLYDLDELKQDVDEVEAELGSWTVKTEWSESLQNIKARDVTTAKDIIKDAVKSLGKEEAGRIIMENRSEITEMINEIMYRGSGTDFIQGRDAVVNDLVRLKTIFAGHTLNQREVEVLSDRMEEEEFQTLVEETLSAGQK